MEWDDKKVKICDLLIKGVLGIVITAAIAFFSIRSENNRQESARQSNKLNVLVEFITKQKELDITQGMRMFETLLGHYFQKDAAHPGPQDPKERLVLLRLIALNFQDLPINLKPLYQQLDGQLTNSKDKDDLKDVGREVARRQAYRLTAANGQDLGVISLKAGEPVELPSLQLTLLADKIARDYIEVQLKFGDKTVGPFQVTYFDVPLIDNTKIGALRMSLILLDSNEQARTADVRVIAFENYLAMDRFDVKDLTLPLSLEKR
jgi:hypothetical protein